MAAEMRFRGSEKTPRFRKWLANLKQVGSSILLTGEVPHEVSARASRKLYGRADRRFRILGLTDRTITNTDTRFPDGASVDDPTTWVVDKRCGERSAQAAAAPTESDMELPEADNAQQLCEEIQKAVDFYDDEAGGLDPGELRIGIDSLFPLVEEDLEATEEALETLHSKVREVQGMAHYHLRVPDDDEIVDELMPLFDARIELRKRPHQEPEQRWYSPEADAKTPWMEL